MLPRYTVNVSPDAQADYDEALMYWAEQRDKAPGALADDVDEAIDRLKKYGPTLGVAVPELGPSHRRLLLPRVRQYVYFRMESPTIVRVLALWHASSGTHPRI